MACRLVHTDVTSPVVTCAVGHVLHVDVPLFSLDAGGDEGRDDMTSEDPGDAKSPYSAVSETGTRAAGR